MLTSFVRVPFFTHVHAFPRRGLLNLTNLRHSDFRFPRPTFVTRDRLPQKKGVPHPIVKTMVTRPYDFYLVLEFLTT